LKKSCSYIASFIFCLQISAQLIPLNDNAVAKPYPFVSVVFNRIFNSNSLDSFYQKLYALKKSGNGVVTIVHIGDSHIQADFLSAVVRNNMQQFFGNAGRGLVFPYQLAQSNAPPDISSSSNTIWQFNRIAHPEIPITPGVSGFCIRTNALGASIDFSLKPNDKDDQSFNRLKFFLDSNASSWILQANNGSSPTVIKKDYNDSFLLKEILLDKDASGFSLSSLPSGNTKEFYGVSLENSKAGVLYHTIGVVGMIFFTLARTEC